MAENKSEKVVDKVKFDERQTVYVTKKGAGYGHEVGEAVELHPKQAEDWLKRGIAAKTEADAKK